MRGRVGQGLDDFQLLDDRTRPAVGHDQRHRVRMLRLHMDEVNVDSANIGDEVRIGVNPRFDVPPVMVVEPIIAELLKRRELYALRCVIDQLTAGPSRGGNPLLQIGEVFVGSAEAKRFDRRVMGAPQNDRFIWRIAL